MKITWMLFGIVILASRASLIPANLSYNFYNESCPRVEEIVRELVEKQYQMHDHIAVSFLRNIFHDCAVQGCDGSMLLRSRPGHPGEQESDKNFGLRNLRYIEEIKEAVEQECPGIVSCADILILSGRDGISVLGGPNFQVKTGRRDTREYSLEAADEQLVPTDVNVTSFLNIMSKFNLNPQQSVAILGAHTVGRTHCKNIVDRLYPDIDPTLNDSYSSYLKKRCPTPYADPKKVEYTKNDPLTPMTFDNNYFKNIMELKGLLKVDDGIYLDPRTQPYVEKFAKDNESFFDQFVEAISILTEYGVLTGSEGEIRNKCNVVNE